MPNFISEIIAPLLQNFEKFAHRNAICIDGNYFTYNDLKERVGAIANHLQTTNDKKVCFVAHDSLDSYAIIFAAWLTNKYYIPLNPSFPFERNLQIIKQMNIEVVFDETENSIYKNDALIIDSTTLLNSNFNFNNAVNQINDDELAYILFTSGSTGEPKGVPISKNNVANFISAHKQFSFGLCEQDKCLQMFDLTFDFSVVAYLLPLLHGACVYTIPPEKVKYQYIYYLLEEEKLTYLFFVPSVLHFFKPYFEEIYAEAVRYCLFCGEALQAEITKSWQKSIPNAKIINTYGPTEATVYCTFCEFDSEKNYRNGIVSMGSIMENNVVGVFDENNFALPSGEIGEVCIAGNQLTSGYVNNNELNAQKFFTIIYDEKPTRFYKTGDLAIKNEDETFDFIGRKDSQIKIHGFRVELADIEFHARNAVNGIANVVCIAKTNDQGSTEIILFYESENIDKERIENYLTAHLPQYMMPKEIITMDRFPLNSNGKINKSQLLSLIVNR